MNNILIYLKLLSRKFDSDNILHMPYSNYFALYYWDTYCRGVDKRLYDEYGKERLWLYYMNTGHIEKFVWDGVMGCYVHSWP